MASASAFGIVNAERDFCFFWLHMKNRYDKVTSATSYNAVGKCEDSHMICPFFASRYWYVLLRGILNRGLVAAKWTTTSGVPMRQTKTLAKWMPWRSRRMSFFWWYKAFLRTDGKKFWPGKADRLWLIFLWKPGVSTGFQMFWALNQISESLLNVCLNPIVWNAFGIPLCLGSFLLLFSNTFKLFQSLKKNLVQEVVKILSCCCGCPRALPLYTTGCGRYKAWVLLCRGSQIQAARSTVEVANPRSVWLGRFGLRVRKFQWKHLETIGKHRL